MTRRGGSRGATYRNNAFEWSELLGVLQKNSRVSSTFGVISLRFKHEATLMLYRSRIILAIVALPLGLVRASSAAGPDVIVGFVDNGREDSRNANGLVGLTAS